MGQKKPTEKEKSVYAREVVNNGGNKSAAWRAAFPDSIAASGSVWNAACAFSKLPGVAEAVAAAEAETREAAKKKFDITIEEVLNRWWSIVTADPRELARVEHIACRYCHGFDHEYQWINEKEFEAAIVNDKDDWGGYGYSTKLRPVEGCPNCHGRGYDHVEITDSRDLSPKAALLYAGVEQTKHGIKVRTHDQGAALRNIAHAMGAFTDNVNHRSPDGSMTPTVIERRIVDPSK